MELRFVSVIKDSNFHNCFSDNLIQIEGIAETSDGKLLRVHARPQHFLPSLSQHPAAFFVLARGHLLL